MVAISQLIRLLDSGYEDKCYELGIIKRQRAIKTPADLMLLSLFHLVNGCTLMEISEMGRIAKIGDFSDVAFMKKFAQCSEWFQWLSEKLIQGAVADYTKPGYLDNYRVVAVDASDVTEKGRSGQLYHLHYAIDIFAMSTVCYKITKQEVGETLRNFTLSFGDLVVADRAYGTLTSMNYCINSGAEYILRLKSNSFCLYDEDGGKIDILGKLSDLAPGESRDVYASAYCHGEYMPVRICALRKTREQIEETNRRLQRKSSKKQVSLSNSAIEFNEYIVVVTSLPLTITAQDILETYRYRWQIECYFKRLKSIMDFGDLPKKLDSSSLSWLNGKIMVALMIEILLSQRSFSPGSVYEPSAEYLEGN